MKVVGLTLSSAYFNSSGVKGMNFSRSGVDIVAESDPVASSI